MPSKIYDIHPHTVSPDTDRYPLKPLGGKRSKASAERPVSFERMTEAMDQAGIAKAALVQPSMVYGNDNSYVADCIAQQPHRFTGVFSVDVLAPDAPEKICYWYDRKCTGLRIFTGGSTLGKQTDTLADPRSFPAWECCADLKIPVCVQLRPEGASQLLPIIKRFPDIKIIVDHMLKPPAEEGPPYNGSHYVLDLAQYANVYLKITTQNVRAAREGKASPETFFPLFVQAFGASRLAWGSNFPSSSGSLPEIVNEAKAALAALSDKDQDWIFYRTAEKLYPALAD